MKTRARQEFASVRASVGYDLEFSKSGKSWATLLDCVPAVPLALDSSYQPLVRLGCSDRRAFRNWSTLTAQQWAVFFHSRYKCRSR